MWINAERETNHENGLLFDSFWNGGAGNSEKYETNATSFRPLVQNYSKSNGFDIGDFRQAAIEIGADYVMQIEKSESRQNGSRMSAQSRLIQIFGRKLTKLCVGSGSGNESRSDEAFCSISFQDSTLLFSFYHLFKKKR
jgi:hypothetical protein